MRYTCIIFPLLVVSCACFRIKWAFPVSGNWNNAALWDLNRVPTELDDVEITCPGNYTVFVSVGQSVKVKSLKIGSLHGAQILDVYLPLFVQEPSIVLSNGVLQLGNSLFGLGSLTVEGKLQLCGHYSALVNISDVDILDGGHFEVWYKQYDSARDCIDFYIGSHGKIGPQQTSKFVVQDEIFGAALATGEICIIVPSTRNGNTPLPQSEHEFYVDMIARQFSLIAGGATTIPANGYWVSDYSKQLIREKVTMVTVATNISPPIKQHLKHLARWLAKDLQQEAVFVKVDGKSFLVRSTDS